MKKFVELVVFLVSCLLSTFVVAQTSAPAATDRLFVVSTSPDQWTNTQKLYAENGVIVGDEVLVAKLAEIAHSNAKASNHPTGKLSEADFAKAFSTRNSALPVNGKLKINSYLVMAQGKGIFLPEAPLVAGVTTSTPVVATVALADKTQVAINAVEVQVKALQVEVAKFGRDRAEVTTLVKSLAEVQKQLEKLDAGQSGFAQKAKDLEAVQAELAKLKIAADALAGLKADVSGVKSSQAGIEGRLVAVEQNPILAVGNSILAVIGLALLFLLGLTAALWRRSATKTAVKQGIEEVVDKVLLVNEKVTKVTGRVVGVEKAVGLLDIQIPDDLEKRLHELRTSWSYTDEIAVEGVGYVLRFYAVGNGMVTVEGIDSQNNEMRIENVRSRIKRAASRGHLVGVKGSVDAGGFPSLVAVA